MSTRTAEITERLIEWSVGHFSGSTRASNAPRVHPLASLYPGLPYSNDYSHLSSSSALCAAPLVALASLSKRVGLTNGSDSLSCHFPIGAPEICSEVLPDGLLHRLQLRGFDSHLVQSAMRELEMHSIARGAVKYGEVWKAFGGGR